MKEFIKKNADMLLKDLMELIEIPSVRGAAAKQAPFGKEVSRGLNYVLQLAENNHLQRKHYDGYMGEVIAKHPDTADADTIIGILCHVDVVAGGEGWNSPPFKATIAEGNLYGRGAMDDKAPIISCLYALKYLQEQKAIPPGIEIRLIIGTDEESNWEDIQYYLDHVSQLPNLSFVPDANFPLILCEKGLLDFDLSCSCQKLDAAPLQLCALDGGTARNVVPAKATCKLTVDPGQINTKELLVRITSYDGISADLNCETNLLSITASGKSTHCMSPEKGISAISRLMHLLFDLGDQISHKEFFETYQKQIGSGYNGEKMGMDFADAVSGKLTFNIGQLSFSNGTFHMVSNIRYPASMPYEKVQDALTAFINRSGFLYREVDHLPAICHDSSAPLIHSLLDAYAQVTGDHENKGFAIGGATYARALPNAVAFGPLFPDEEELAHEPNECIKLDSLWKMTEIYITAIENLIKTTETGGKTNAGNH